jgi:hypothetical protein
MGDEHPEREQGQGAREEDAGRTDASGQQHPRRPVQPHPPLTPGESRSEPGERAASPLGPALDRSPSAAEDAVRPAPDVAPASPPAGAPAATLTARPGRFPAVVRLQRAVDVDLEKLTLAQHRQSTNRITGWLYQKEEVAHHAARSWYQVLCLTGVDYFSTLGYQPGIAYLAAGLLSPVATLILVIFTLVGALPTYSRVAAESPHGQGSIAMLERLLPRWRGKLFVLCLLGFAATDFVITITLSAADATAHIVENPFFPHSLATNRPIDIVITVLLIGLLGGVFLKGFREAIGLAVLLVVVYLGLNFVVVARALAEVSAESHVVRDWTDALRVEHGNPLTMLGVSLLLFPKLALGLSGFETGVAVMPVVRGDPDDTEEDPKGRIRNTRRLLASAALIMSVYLITSSLVTTLLIPKAAFEDGGGANGRALAYLAHQQLGDIFGTAYDASTISILWFAGASAMAGLLNLVPRYLPGYGMAPRWAAAQRPLVLVFIVIAFVVTLIFRADVNAQGAAYATGVLVLMASASIAVTISLFRSSSRWVWVFVPITLSFFYITVQNVRERPGGLVIATFFIVAIVVTSAVSRVLRSTELRVSRVVIDRTANQIIRSATRDGGIRLITHDPLRGTEQEAYDQEVEEARRRHGIPPDDPILLLEVRTDDPSVFLDELLVTGHTAGPYVLLRCDGAAIANAIAALALAVHGQYGCTVHLHMRWTPINSVLDALVEGFEFLLWGGGDMARLVELEIRREAADREIIVHAA